VVAGEIINSEFQWISRESDVLIRVESKEYGKFLVLNVLQLRYKPEMPRRMRAYAGLAEEKYKLPTYPVLINILKTGDTEIPTRYESNLAGLEVRQDYRVINLWEVDVKLVFEQKISTLLPFVPILQGGNSENNLRLAVTELRKDEQLKDLEPLLSFFASFVLDIPLIQQIMRWDMTVLRESPWYEEILKEGLQQGEKQGLQQGLQQGESVLVLRQLTRRFGEIEFSMREKIKKLPTTELEILGESLLDFSQLQDLIDWLAVH
jgi:predicted transposase YdaD